MIIKYDNMKVFGWDEGEDEMQTFRNPIGKKREICVEQIRKSNLEIFQ